jgi:chromosome segregation ATPase
MSDMTQAETELRRELGKAEARCASWREVLRLEREQAAARLTAMTEAAKEANSSAIIERADRINAQVQLAAMTERAADLKRSSDLMEIELGAAKLDYSSAQQEIARLREEINAQHEVYAWDYTPAMAQAKIDQLNAQLTAMTHERDEVRLRRQETITMCVHLECAMETLRQNLTAMTERAMNAESMLKSETQKLTEAQQEIARLRLFVGKVLESRRNYWRHMNEMAGDPTNDATLTRELRQYDPLYNDAEQALTGNKEGG